MRARARGEFPPTSRAREEENLSKPDILRFSGHRAREGKSTVFPALKLDSEPNKCHKHAVASRMHQVPSPSVIQLAKSLPLSRDRGVIGRSESDLLKRLSETEEALAAALGMLGHSAPFKESKEAFTELAEKRRQQSRDYKTLSFLAEL